jgi:hypothetical protein
MINGLSNVSYQARGFGNRTGRGSGQGRGAGGMGRRGSGAGPGGNCMCPKCGTRIPHKAGTPCYSEKCPQCGANMVRER